MIHLMSSPNLAHLGIWWKAHSSDIFKMSDEIDLRLNLNYFTNKFFIFIL